MKTAKIDKSTYSLVLDPLYLINSKCSTDKEWLEYTILGALQKYKEKLDNNNIQVFSEIFLHYFNLSSLINLSIIFDKKHKSHDIYTNKDLSKIIDILKYDTSEREYLINIYNWIKEKLRDVFIEAIEKHIKVYGGLNLLVKNKQIHLTDDIYIFCKSNPNLYSEIWRIKIDERCNFMSSIKFIDVIKEDSNSNYTKLSQYVNKLKNIENKINNNNIIIVNNESAINYNDIIYIIRDILFLNRNLDEIFETKGFDNDILYILLEFINNGGF